MREIPGWKIITEQDLVDKIILNDACPGAHYVDGKWYLPDEGGAPLQKLVDEWLEAVGGVYLYTSGMVGGKRVGNHTRSFRDAERTLREWGRLDVDGQLIER